MRAAGERLGLQRRLGGDRQVFGADDAVAGVEQSGFKDAGQFADVAGPVVLQEARQGAGSEGDGPLLVARADAIEQGLGEGSDIFAALPQRRNGEADRGEAESEVGHEESLSGHLAQAKICEEAMSTTRPGGRSCRALSTARSRPWPGEASRSTRSR